MLNNDVEMYAPARNSVISLTYEASEIPPVEKYQNLPSGLEGGRGGVPRNLINVPRIIFQI